MKSTDLRDPLEDIKKPSKVALRLFISRSVLEAKLSAGDSGHYMYNMFYEFLFGHALLHAILRGGLT